MKMIPLKWLESVPCSRLITNLLCHSRDWPILCLRIWRMYFLLQHQTCTRQITIHSWWSHTHFWTQWYAHQRGQPYWELCWQYHLLSASTPRLSSKVSWCPTPRCHFFHVITLWKRGWPKKEQREPSLCNDLLLRGLRIVVSTSLQADTLEKIYSGHQGIQWCLMATAVWWPVLSMNLSNLCRIILPAQRLACHSDSQCSPQSSQVTHGRVGHGIPSKVVWPTVCIRGDGRICPWVQLYSH